MNPYHFSNRNQRCNCTVNKTETKLYDHLKENTMSLNKLNLIGV